MNLHPQYGKQPQIWSRGQKAIKKFHLFTEHIASKFTPHNDDYIASILLRTLSPPYRDKTNASTYHSKEI